jgi:hypothetical protein
MGKACSTDGRNGNRKKIVTNPKGRGSLKTYVHWTIILMWILTKKLVEWINLSQDRVKWETLANTVMNVRIMSNYQLLKTDSMQ